MLHTLYGNIQFLCFGEVKKIKIKLYSIKICNIIGIQGITNNIVLFPKNKRGKVHVQKEIGGIHRDRRKLQTQMGYCV